MSDSLDDSSLDPDDEEISNIGDEDVEVCVTELKDFFHWKITSYH